MRTAIIVTLTLCSVPFAVMAADIYRWVDANGQVHFGTQPRPGAEQLDVRPQVIERDEATREREARTGRFFEARRQEQQAAGQVAAESNARRNQACKGWERELSDLSRGGRYFRVDAKGERVYYSDDEIETARRQLASRISQSCN